MKIRLQKFFINPRRMREGYDSHTMCVYYNASCYIPGLYDANKVPFGFLRHFQGLNYVDFAENTSLKSFGRIC